MERIVHGTAQHSNGALTIVALAQEAGVPRNALTQRHLDLKNEFYEHVRARGATPDAEKRLRAQLVKAKELRAVDLKQIEQLRADVEALVRALHLSQTENRQLRKQLAEAIAPRLRLLPNQPSPPQPVT
ncbi:hypothetical protein [Kitasatospora sp. NPDC005856]|uniref:hypothetical protein n=1 Tax=Kitasatospora sp. NPDC005856 TaxID=3154566 RepID=UPI00340B72FC